MSKNIDWTRIAKIALPIVLVVITVGALGDSAQYKKEVAMLEETVRLKDEELKDAKRQYREEIEGLQSKSEAVVEYAKNVNKMSRDDYIELSKEYEELKLQKSVPVYYCNHDEKSAILLIRDFMENGPWFFESDYRDEDGNEIIYITDGLVESYEMWWDWFSEACDYENYEQYEEYLWSIEDYEAIEELSSGYGKRYEAWLESQGDED